MAYEVYSRKADPFGNREGDSISQGSPSWVAAESVIKGGSEQKMESSPLSQAQSKTVYKQDNNQIIKLSMAFPPIGVVTHG
tara:strand:- start:611 stop:853 length:243 start_codon:yes stop_codon:yes gene_type:complete